VRVTDQMLGNVLQQDLQSIQQRLLQQQQQLASGQQINQPSDNPAGTEQVLSLNHALAENQQYEANAQQALTWLQTTGQALTNIVQLAQSLRTLAVGTTGTMPASQVQALASQAAALLQSMVDAANTQQAGLYVFAGTDVQQSSPPFSLNASGQVTYQGNGLAMRMAIGPAAEVQTNTPGTVLLPLFSAVSQIVSDLQTGTTASLAQVGGSDLSTLDQALQGVISAQGVAGSMAQEVQDATTQLSSYGVQLQQLRASVLDTNVASAVVHLQQLENTYQSALAVGAQLMQPTLAKYL